MSGKYKLIILDRDGVINEDSEEYIKSPEEWIPIAGSLAAIAKLNQAGYKVVVATNQSGIARGYFTGQTLQKIHQKMRDELAKAGGHLDDIVYCPHHPDDNCLCRKPEPGMLKKILQKFNVSAKEVLYIGDSLKDILVAKRIGCDAFFVKTGKGERILKQYADELKDILIFDGLAAAAGHRQLNR